MTRYVVQSTLRGRHYGEVQVRRTALHSVAGGHEFCRSVLAHADSGSEALLLALGVASGATPPPGQPSYRDDEDVVARYRVRADGSIWVSTYGVVDAEHEVR